jgi:antitoxin component of MazEF toxin-antitoxin module
MKIQKRFLRKYKDKDYYKYVVNIPQMVLKEAGLKYGEELEIKPEKGKLVFKRKNQKKVKEKN